MKVYKNIKKGSESSKAVDSRCWGRPSAKKKFVKNTTREIEKAKREKEANLSKKYGSQWIKHKSKGEALLDVSLITRAIQTCPAIIPR